MRHKKARNFFRVTIPPEPVSLRIVVQNPQLHIEYGGQWRDVAKYVAGSATFEYDRSPYEHYVMAEE